MRGLPTLMALTLCCASSASAAGFHAILTSQAPSDRPSEQPADGGIALGRVFPAVNGTEIRCALHQPRSEADMARQFDTRPQDLDELTARAKEFMAGLTPAGAEFRKKQAVQRAEDWSFLCRYRDENARYLQAGHRPTAVFIGDSITEGWIEAHPGFFETNDYVDRGIMGQSSSQLVVRFYSDVVALHPKVVHIMVGTNDIGGATGPITMNEFIGNVGAMIDMAKAAGIKVVLAGIPPMSRLLPRPDFDTRKMVRAVNARLLDLAAQRHVTWVDYFTPLAAADGAFDPRLANDGVHPTRQGYAIMEPLAKRAVTLALSRAPTRAHRSPRPRGGEKRRCAVSTMDCKNKF